MSDPGEPLRRIVVVGDGQVGVLAALAMKQALPGSEVVVLATPADPAAFADRASTALPFTNRLHQRLGVLEEDIVRQAGGSHRLVTRLLGWGEEGQWGCFVYGAAGDAVPGGDFGRRWGGGSRTDTTGHTPRSLAELLAGQDRFAPPPGGQPNPLDGVEYALRWHPAAYRDLLVARAQQAGIGYTQGRLAAVERDEAAVAALRLDDGQAIEADLFLDCSGPGALLVSQADGYAMRDWSAALPIRAIGYEAPGQAILALEDRAQLSPHGWAAQIAGRDGLQVLHGLTGDAEHAVRFEPSAIRECWLGNVVAIGDAAARFEPLGNLNLDFAHRQIDLLLELLPGRRIDPAERAEYNRRAGLMANRVRDTLGLFYAAPAAAVQFGELDRSDQLSRWLDQFVRRGRVPFAEETPLQTGELRSLLTALGFSAGTGPLARATPPDSGQFAARAEAALRHAPPYGQWVERVTGQR